MTPVKHWWPHTKAILTIFLEAYDKDPNHEVYAYGLIKDTGMGQGAIYPMLRRLTTGGWLIAREERRHGRGHITYYRLSPEHAETVRAELVKRSTLREWVP